MSDIFCRIITKDCSDCTTTQVISFIKSKLALLDVRDITFSQIIPYWKSEGQGEITCQFSTSRTLDEVRSLFADKWESNTADSRWSNIHCPSVAFLWISC